MLTLALLSVIALFVSGQRALRQSQRLATATGLCKTMIDQIRAQDLSSLPLPQSFDGRVPTPPLGSFPPAPYPQVEREQTYRLAVWLTATGDRAVDVRVRVYWDGAWLEQETLILP